jgi:hypothetical protein
VRCIATINNFRKNSTKHTTTTNNFMNLNKWGECNNNQQLETTYELEEITCTTRTYNVRSLKRWNAQQFEATREVEKVRCIKN